MSLATLLQDAERRRKRMVYYAPEPGDVAEQFSTRNVTVEHRYLPSDGPDPFVVIMDGDQYRGSITVEDLHEYLWPPVRDVPDRGTLSPEYRALIELLDDTVFGSLSRRQLLGTTREFEDRALRIGRGAFHVGFQRLDAFEPQVELYRHLAESTDLDVHVYLVVEDHDDLPDLPVTYHTEPVDDIAPYWFLVFDGAGADDQKCALIAEQQSEDAYYGTWTYEASIVDQALAAL